MDQVDSAKTGAGTFTATSSDSTPVAANSGRNALSITNNSANDVSLGLGVAAVQGQGIVLKANGGSWDGLVSGVLWIGSVHAIAPASSAVGFVEL